MDGHDDAGEETTPVENTSAPPPVEESAPPAPVADDPGEVGAVVLSPPPSLDGHCARPPDQACDRSGTPDRTSNKKRPIDEVDADDEVTAKRGKRGEPGEEDDALDTPADPKTVDLRPGPAVLSGADPSCAVGGDGNAEDGKRDGE